MKKSVFLSGILPLYKKKELDVADHLKTVEGDDIDDQIVSDLIKEWDAEKVQNFKTEATERFNNGFKKGELQKAKKFESRLRAKFDIDDSLEGDDLLDAIDEISIGEGGGTPSDLSKLSEDDLKKIPAYQKKEREHAKALKAKEEFKSQIEAEKQSQEAAKLIAKAEGKALEILTSSKAVLSPDEKKAKNQKENLLLSYIRKGKFIVEGDEIIPVDEEGKQLLDSNGNPIDFETFTGSIIESNFDISEEDNRSPSSPGNKNIPGKASGGKAKWNGKAPKTSSEYLELLTDDSIDEDQKIALTETYGEQFSE